MKGRTIECPRCSGTGNLGKKTVRTPEGLEIEITIECPNCNGSGVIVIITEHD